MTGSLMAMGRQIIAIGECMVELSRGGDDRFGLAYGGDTFNTAVYMARCGLDVAYATAVGDDPYSSGIRSLAAEEGIDPSLIAVEAGRMPGLYIIETDTRGERSFYYWRDHSPARSLLDSPDAPRIVAAIRAAGLVYFSGITLSLYSSPALERFASALAAARASGAHIVMDGNWRPRGWGGDENRARATFERFWRLADIALPTFDDEAALWGDDSPATTVARLTRLGVAEVAVKLGSGGAMVGGMGVAAGIVAIPETVATKDTTAAGDSFNAAYLAARLCGRHPREAALAGHRLAGTVVQHRGAIVPRAATDPAIARDLHLR